MEERLARIRAGVERLRQLDLTFATFGASSHHFRFGPTLTPDELGKLEDRYGVRLPEEYRQFLMHIGNGGCGPGYGLSRFGWLDSPDGIPQAKPTGRMITVATGPNFSVQTSEMVYPDGTIADNFDLSFYYGMVALAHDHSALRKPFPLTEPMLPSFEEEEEEEEDEHPSVDLSRGAFPLGTYGCGIDPLLIVTGPFAGRVWVDDRCNADAVLPFEDYGPEDTMHGGELRKPGPHNFLDWYEDWLETAIEIAERSQK